MECHSFYNDRYSAFPPFLRCREAPPRNLEIGRTSSAIQGILSALSPSERFTRYSGTGVRKPAQVRLQQITPDKRA
jgi:hypothetical protein